MALRLPVPIRYVRWPSVAGYLLLGLAVHFPIHSSRLPEFLGMVFIGAVLLSDVIMTQRAELTALFIARRGAVTAFVVTICMVLAAWDLEVAHATNTLWHAKVLVIQFALQGALVGVIVRVLVLAMFARLLRGVPIETSRLLLLAALTVLVWLAPLAQAHRVFASVYVLGFGAGFTVHYLVRRKEHTRAQTARLGRYIVESLGHVKLEDREITAVRHYAKQKWRRLDELLQDDNDLTTVLAIIKASRLRIKGHYDNARRIIEAKLNEGERDVTLRTFLYLHLALNLADSDLRPQMHEALNKAMECHGDCLLSLVTNGLRTAEEIPLDEGDDAEEHEEDPRRKIALKYIWEALKINDVARPELVARIVGRSVPLTWTFLLDAYAYVLLKARHARFSKALLTECIYEDPYFSSPYLHLGEWCIADLIKARRQLVASSQPTGLLESSQKEVIRANSERSRRVARLCLNIAVKLEGNRQSLTKRRAQELLKSYSDLLYEAL